MYATQAGGSRQLRDAYELVSQRIAHAATRCGRQPKDVLMVAVTKYAGLDEIRTLVELGQVDLGESRVQQLAQRAAALSEFLQRRRTLTEEPLASKGPSSALEVRWHMVGHLQRNKVKQVLPLVRLIHSVDNLRVAEEIQHYAARMEQTAEILLQINTTGDPSRYGVATPAAIHVAEQIDTMVHIRLRGVMTMAPPSINPEDARPHFARAAEIYEDIRTSGIGGSEFNILSMGMSDDFEVAIEEGSNLVRIGRALFGQQPPVNDALA